MPLVIKLSVAMLNVMLNVVAPIDSSAATAAHPGSLAARSFGGIFASHFADVKTA